MSRAPEIRYTKSGDLNIAYAVTGEGPDLVVAPGFISHLEVGWEELSVAHFYSRLASFRRVITFDKRGTVSPIRRRTLPRSRKASTT
jgi:hypothetical protein